ncbi:SWI SNF complex subunit SWI3A [Olea europaea subsp. europaea]|uniref:SWI SNF complex subunit SWI3A n=2 Tax=Olea europaea subsp. europaea TaxID=158383 RepID=A0A8S0Q8Z3_OLEEU|nr:SWI SNF complex subunit SWI3A [Olea europaea subsp. europaea]
MEKNFQELESYSVPSSSNWFSWSNIHEVERFSLREFFDGSSITRSPRIYKEYRDFIISKYREDPSRKLTFTEVRKSLVGDVSILHKVFTFLEKWGLINFDVKRNNEGDNCNGNGKTTSVGGEEEEESWKGRVKLEEGAPYGVRVVAAPNSMKPVAQLPPPTSVSVDGGRGIGEVGHNGFKWPPLASYSDVFADLAQQEKKGLVCRSCKENCDSMHYEYTKEGSFILCEKCFKSGNYEENNSADDFKLINSGNQNNVWTEAETLHLLESVLKHGDDWDLVAQDVQTKSKMDCISKLMELPFGDRMLGSAQRKRKFLDLTGDVSNLKQGKLAFKESQESAKVEDPSHELKDEGQQNGYTDTEGQPPKRIRMEPTSNTTYLMNQVARISTAVGPHVTASAAEAAVTALCYENQCSREVFDEDNIFVDLKASAENIEQKRAAQGNLLDGDEGPKQSEIQGPSSEKDTIQINLRMRAATATALGAAAAHAKYLADQEERRMEQLMAIMIETQMKKLKRKMKYFDELELIMEKENAHIEELEESLVADRLNVLQRIFNAGISRWKDHASVKSETGSVQ